jgi:hypothetical protein
LGKRHALISEEFLDVLEDVSGLAAAIIRDGFREAVGRLPNFVPGSADRPFIEIADAIVEHHTRLVRGPDRDIVRKSLLEAYIHAAGPQYAFGSVGKTRLVRSLRQSGATKFAALIFSLHLFNVISLDIQDDLRADMADAKTFELYMLGLETICRDAVKSALNAIETEGANGGPLYDQPGSHSPPLQLGTDGRWARALAANVEMQLAQSAVKTG